MPIVTDPMAPPEWLTFIIIFVALVLIFVLMILVAGIQRWLRGESFWPAREREEGDERRPSPSRIRSGKLRTRHNSANSVQTGSARPNADSQAVQGVRQVAHVQTVQPPRPLYSDNIPTSVDEVQRLAHTITLYSKRPNKEMAIKEAWGATKGEGDVYQRASLLFDTAMSDAARFAAKQKGGAILMEAELA